MTKATIVVELPKRDTRVPDLNDVVMGRGTGVAQHVGNAMFRFHVDQNRAKYQQAAKTEKSGIALAIVHAITQRGGSFVHPVKVGGKVRFRTVPLQLALNKTSQALRELNLSCKRNECIQQALASTSPMNTMKLPALQHVISPAVAPVAQLETPATSRHPMNKNKKATTKTSTVTKAKKKTKTTQNSRTTAKWDAVVTPPPKNSRDLTPPPPTKPRHSRTTRAVIQAQEHEQQVLANNKNGEEQPRPSAVAGTPPPSLGQPATSVVVDSAGQTLGQSERSDHHRSALPVKKRPLLRDFTFCHQDQEPEADATSHLNDAAAVSASSIEFIPIVPSTGNAVSEEARGRQALQALELDSSSMASRWNMIVPNEAYVPLTVANTTVSPPFKTTAGGDVTSKSSPTLSLGQIESIASEGVASPLEEHAGITTATCTHAEIRVANQDSDWGQAPSPRPTSISNGTSAANASLQISGRPSRANVRPSARAISDSTQRMNYGVNVYPAHSPGGTISTNRMSMVTPSSAFMMTSPSMFGRRSFVSGNLQESPLFGALFNENDSYRSVYEKSSSDTRAFHFHSQILGSGKSPPSAPEATMASMGIFVTNNAETSSSNLAQPGTEEDHIFGSPEEKTSLDLCCLFCSPGNSQGWPCPIHPFRASAGNTTPPSTFWNHGELPHYSQHASPANLSGWSPIGKEIHVPPPAVGNGAIHQFLHREASPSPRRMFASVIPPCVSGASSGAIQSSPTGLSTVASGFSRWTPSPLFPVTTCFSPDPTTRQEPSSAERGGITFLLEAAQAAKVLDFEDSAASKHESKHESSAGIRKRKAKDSLLEEEHNRPEKRPTQMSQSLPASYEFVSVSSHRHASTQAGYQPSPRRISDVKMHNMDPPLTTSQIHPGALLWATKNQSRLQTEQIAHYGSFPLPSGRRLSDNSSSPCSGGFGVPGNSDHCMPVASEANHHQPAASPMPPVKSCRRVSY